MAEDLFIKWTTGAAFYCSIGHCGDKTLKAIKKDALRKFKQKPKKQQLKNYWISYRDPNSGSFKRVDEKMRVRDFLLQFRNNEVFTHMMAKPHDPVSDFVRFLEKLRSNKVHNPDKNMDDQDSSVPDFTPSFRS